MTSSPEKKIVVRRKDFIKENVQCARRSCPSQPKRRFVDTHRGDAHDLDNSGLLPVYVYKKSYGKIPKFVAVGAKTAMDVEMEATERDIDRDEMSKLSSCRYIDEEERKKLLDGMKQKWDEAMKRFQGLPFLADTPPKAQRKARLERELQQLERDIAIIEQHPHLYVYDANDA